MEYRLVLASAISIAFLVGCNSKPKNEPMPQPPQIIQDQKQALDNAKGVSEAIGKQADEQKKQVEEATK